ncbi:hypothetical protein DdX_17633 [Ditylenchus destructor]|uniref:Uncharacterized protein n=1 Tax=Ditylenchus destructor TaxID=166010 RepID=A0AAD4ML22_9BILA|nr:hypothetical protein DdX_17633 [Ditylenchus destructor]
MLANGHRNIHFTVIFAIYSSLFLIFPIYARPRSEILNRYQIRNDTVTIAADRVRPRRILDPFSVMLDYDPRFYHYQPLYYYTSGDKGQRQRWSGFDLAASESVLFNVTVFERQLEIFLSRSPFYPPPERQFNASTQGFFSGTVLNHIPPTVSSNQDIPSVLGTFTDDGVFFGDVSLPDDSSFHFMPTKGDALLDGKAFHSIVYREKDVRPGWGPWDWKDCAPEICSRSELECFCPLPFSIYMFDCLVYYPDD